MRTYDLTLDGVTGTRLLIDYSFFLVLADGGSSFDVEVFNSSGFKKCTGVSAGFGMKLTSQTRGKEFIFSSATPQTIKVFVGDDEAVYQRLSGTVTVSNFPIAGGFSQVTSTLSNVALIISGARQRKYFFVQNNDPVSVMRVYVNGNAATANQGIRLQPGESWGIEGGICPNSNITGVMETATTRTSNVEVVEF